MSLLYRYARSAFGHRRLHCRPLFPAHQSLSCVLPGTSPLVVPKYSGRIKRGRKVRSGELKAEQSTARFFSDLRRGGRAKQSVLEQISSQPLQLADVLHNVKAKLLSANAARTRTSAVLEGVGRHLGLDIKWTMTVGPDGGFVERFAGESFSCTWGASPGPPITCWETDYSGVSRSVELDDFESCLLTTWLRTGQWLDPSVLQTLHLELIENMPSPLLEQEQNSLASNGRQVREETNHSNGSSASSRPVATVDLSVRLKTGKVKVTVVVDRATWLPFEIRQDLFGDRETWLLCDWKLWGDSQTWYPERVLHTATSGGNHRYITTSGQGLFLAKNSQMQALSFFQPPNFDQLPPDFTFDHSVSPIVPAWKTLSCHILVKPQINGKEIGYMIVDTGASGLVMEKEAADALELVGFGELFVSGVSGKVPAHFRRAESLKLGPLTLERPQFMEMPVPGLVAGPCSPVIGIIGYDIFRRAVVEIQPKANAKQPLSATEPNVLFKLYDAENPPELPDVKPKDWSHLHMITNLPHVKAQFSTNGSAVYEGLFMIDTGAGGAFVMFMSRAATEYGLQNDLNTNSRTFVKGVGGSQTAKLPVQNGTLSWFEIGGKRLDKISCLFFSGAKMDISVYACGILCMNMLQDSRFIIDYARQRTAVLHLDSSLEQTREPSDH